MVRRPRIALLAALGGIAALALLWALAYAIPFGHWLDSSALWGFADLSRPRLVPIAESVGALAHPGSFVLLGAALTAIALARGRPRTALAIPLILLGASGTTEILKHALAQHRFADWMGATDQIAAVSWPSGHATASMALALCAVLAAPPRLRPLAAAVGAAFAVAVSYSILILQWHYPSDVLAGFLVAGVWTLLGVAALGAAQGRWPARTGRAAVLRVRDAVAPSAVGIAGALACAAAVAFARPRTVLAYADAHTAFLAGALAIGGLSVALALALALALRR
jgi:membrane-associated phospholipid phosphatase